MFESLLAENDRLERRVSRIPTNMAQLEYLNMRELNEHKINPGNDTLTITVLDEPDVRIYLQHDAGHAKWR